MNLNQLEYFVAVAESLNFTKAAKKCFISQTAMTQQIKALEKSVGVPLFVRDKHHVELTAAGKVYLNEARVIIDRSNEALRLARLASEGVAGKITIGFIKGFGLRDFSNVLKLFHAAYPNIEIHLLRNNMSVLLESLANKECDVVLSVAPKQDDPEFCSRYIKSYPVMAVLPEGHPLAGQSHLTYEDLKYEKFIMMQPTNRPKDQMEESLLIYKRGGYLPDVSGIESEPETLLMMISAGMGISILPEYIIRLYEKNPEYAIRPMVKTDGSAETVDMEVRWRKDNANPAVEQLLEFLAL